MKKKIAILGSSGSIGTQTLEVIRKNKDKFSVELITANNNADLLIKQAIEFLPNYVVITNPEKYQHVKQNLEKYPVKVFAGIESVVQVIEIADIDIVLTAMVGYAGLIPTLKAIESGKNIALANKETLVVAGELIMKAAKQHNISIYPVDSEHSAIYQSIVGEDNKKIEKIYLTASGGPFRDKDINFIAKATPEQALKHPNWNMGNKITIDSASMMNKGLEVIEAKWLFDLTPDQIDVIVHPQSIIHSLVQFIDGSLKAQLGLPDMKLPIVYALSQGERIKTDFKRFNFADYPELTFEKPDITKFPNLRIAFEALNKAGNVPCVMNAANEIAVEAFLKEKIGFLQMSDIIEKTIAKVPYKKNLSIDDYIETDKIARQVALSLI